MALFKGLRQENIRRIWVSDLDVLHVMLRRYSVHAQQRNAYMPYEQSIAELFSIGCHATSGKNATECAENIRKTCRLGARRMDPELAELLYALVSKHEQAVDNDRWGIQQKEFYLKPTRNK